LKLKAGQVKLQSRLEEEEQEKAALMGRIQRLTKLILVSTKNTIPSNIPERSGHRRRHSFGEEEVCRCRAIILIVEDDVVYRE
jgi:centromeric protein E